MRLFTGIDLPDDVINVFERLLVRFRPAAHLKWSPAYNLHITARFIGEWPEAKLDELKEALLKVPPRPPIKISFRGLGWFPNERALGFSGLALKPVRNWWNWRMISIARWN